MSALTLGEPEAQDYLDEAAETYSSANTANAYARVIALRGFLASAAKMASYQQNESRESLSDVYDHLSDLLEYWESTVGGVATASGNGAFRSGRTARKPKRVMEYPDEAPVC